MQKMSNYEVLGYRKGDARRSKKVYSLGVFVAPSQEEAKRLAGCSFLDYHPITAVKVKGDEA